jgi:S-adenosylmethionine synthetase
VAVLCGGVARGQRLCRSLTELNVTARFDEEITALLRKTVDMTPAGIIRRLDLRRPIYAPTAEFGHFGVADRPWEQLDLAPVLKELAGI